MSTAAIETPAAPVDTSPTVTDFGSKADLRESLFDGIDDAPTDDAPDADAAPAAAKTDNAAEKKTDAKVDEDAEAIKAINRRSAERRKARQQARTEGRPLVETAPPAEAPKSQLTAQEKLAADATREVLQQIARLAGGDDDAAAEAAKTGEGSKPDPQRDALASDIKAKIDGAMKALQDGVGAENKKLVDELKSMRTQLDAINAAREVRDHITRQFIPLEENFPALSDPAAIRSYNKEHGTSHRDAVDLIHEVMGRTFDKHGYVPKVKFIAEAIEKKLTAAKSPEKTEQKKPSRTLSNSLGSPPAARTDPDERTAEEAEADFNRRFGLKD